MTPERGRIETMDSIVRGLLATNAENADVLVPRHLLTDTSHDLAVMVEMVEMTATGMTGVA